MKKEGYTIESFFATSDQFENEVAAMLVYSPSTFKEISFLSKFYLLQGNKKEMKISRKNQGNPLMSRESSGNSLLKKL